jgi:hypothetical protein
LSGRSKDADATGHGPATLDRRAHRRSRSEQIRLTFLGADHVPLNWSEGGALIADRHPDLEVGAIIAGILIIGPNSLRFRFSAEVIRRDPQTKQLAIQFIDPSPALSHALVTANS